MLVESGWGDCVGKMHGVGLLHVGCVMCMEGVYNECQGILQGDDVWGSA